jgi:hypothetical protein
MYFGAVTSATSSDGRFLSIGRKKGGVTLSSFAIVDQQLFQ